MELKQKCALSSCRQHSFKLFGHSLCLIVSLKVSGMQQAPSSLFYTIQGDMHTDWHSADKVLRNCMPAKNHQTAKLKLDDLSNCYCHLADLLSFCRLAVILQTSCQDRAKSSSNLKANISYLGG